MGLQCGGLFIFLFLDSLDDLKAFDTSFFESSMLFFNVLFISPDSNKFFAVVIATFFADFLNLLPKGLFAVFLMILGEDFITAFPIGSNVLNKVLKTPPIPLPLCKIAPL